MEAKELNETVERARVALANANWDESKHPRGPGGRFGKGTGGEEAAGKKLFHDIGEGDSVWVTQNGKDKKYKVKSFYRDAHRFDGGFFTLVDDKGNEVGADSAWVNK